MSYTGEVNVNKKQQKFIQITGATNRAMLSSSVRKESQIKIRVYKTWKYQLEHTGARRRP